ncbi:transposase [Amaricoccus sp.]|uniref:transposase n=1 Tax=Amaricoccus sp. TaxID=1872485 RepID=UPI0034579735
MACCGDRRRRGRACPWCHRGTTVSSSPCTSARSTRSPPPSTPRWAATSGLSARRSRASPRSPAQVELAAEVILSGIGRDMGRFPTAGHLLSWAGLCPHKSGGRAPLHLKKGAPG